MKDTTGRSGGPRAEGGTGAAAGFGAAARDGRARSREGEVVAARFGEAVEFDAAKVSALFADLGSDGAQATILRAMDALDARLGALGDAAGAPDDLGKAARRIVGIADGIGMATLTRAARNAADAAAGEPVAAAATAARLSRVGALSLAAIRDTDGTST